MSGHVQNFFVLAVYKIKSDVGGLRRLHDDLMPHRPLVWSLIPGKSSSLYRLFEKYARVCMH